MARTKGARDRKERKNSLSRNLKAHAIQAGRGALTGSLLGGISLPLIRNGRPSIKGGLKGAVIGGAVASGLSELAWQAGKEGRKKMGYGNADRLDITSDPQKYNKKALDYFIKEQKKQQRKKK